MPTKCFGSVFFFSCDTFPRLNSIYFVFITGRVNHLLLLLEKDPWGSQLSSPPQTPPPARLPPHQDANCFNSCQHSLTPPLQRVLYVGLTFPVRVGDERQTGLVLLLLKSAVLQWLSSFSSSGPQLCQRRWLWQWRQRAGAEGLRLPPLFHDQ